MSYSHTWIQSSGRFFFFLAWLFLSLLGLAGLTDLSARTLIYWDFGQTGPYAGNHVSDTDDCTVYFTAGPMPQSAGTYTIHAIGGATFTLTVQAIGTVTYLNPSNYQQTPLSPGGYSATLNAGTILTDQENGSTGDTFGIVGYDDPHGLFHATPVQFVDVAQEQASGDPTAYTSSGNCVLTADNLQPTPTPAPTVTPTGGGSTSNPTPGPSVAPTPGVGVGTGAATGTGGGTSTSDPNAGPAATPGTGTANGSGSADAQANTANLAKVANATQQPTTTYKPDAGDPGTFNGSTAGGDWSWTDGKQLAQNMQAAPGAIQGSLNPLYDAGTGFTNAAQPGTPAITSITIPLNWQIGTQTVASLTMDFTPYAAWITVGRNLLLFGLIGTMIVMFARAPAKYL